MAGRHQWERADGRASVCHETIYRHVYGPEGRREACTATCPRRAAGKESRYGRRPRSTSIPRERWIESRPAEVDNRGTFGRWEADLLNFREEVGKADVTSLVERKSRFTFLLANGTSAPRRWSPASPRRSGRCPKVPGGPSPSPRDRAPPTPPSTAISPGELLLRSALPLAERRRRERERSGQAFPRARARPRRSRGPASLARRPAQRHAPALPPLRTPREVFQRRLAAPTGPP